MHSLHKAWFIVPSVLLIVALFPMPYVYYETIRAPVAFAACVIAYKYSDTDNQILMYSFITVAVVFNPIIPAHFKRDVWSVIDIVVASLFIGSRIWAPPQQPLVSSPQTATREHTPAKTSDDSLPSAEEILRSVIDREYEVPTMVFSGFTISEASGLAELQSIILESLNAVCSKQPTTHDQIENLIYRHNHNIAPLLTFADSCDDYSFGAAFNLLGALNTVDKHVSNTFSGTPELRQRENELVALQNSALKTLAIDRSEYEYPNDWPWQINRIGEGENE